MEHKRIQTEQLIADNALLERLSVSLTGWRTELELIERDLIEQALIDAKHGARSSRYLALEKRDKDLKGFIADAENKLGQVQERYAPGSIGKLINDTINQLKP